MCDVAPNCLRMRLSCDTRLRWSGKGYNKPATVSPAMTVVILLDNNVETASVEESPYSIFQNR